MNRFSNDRGETLVEMVITVMVLAIGVVGVMAAMGAAINVSSAHRSQATSEGISDTFGELIVEHSKDLVVAHPDGSYTFAQCPRSSDLMPTASEFPPAFNATSATPTEMQVAPSGTSQWFASITKVEYWLPDATDFPNGSFTRLDGSSNDTGDCQAQFKQLCGDGSTDPGSSFAFPECQPGLLRITTLVTNKKTDATSDKRIAHVLIRRPNEVAPS